MPETIPCFEDVVKVVASHNIMLNIEIKEFYSEENEQRCISCIEKVIEIVEKYNLREKIVLNSFDAWVLEYVYKKYGKKYMLHGFIRTVLCKMLRNPMTICIALVFLLTRIKHTMAILSKKILSPGLVRA